MASIRKYLQRTISIPLLITFVVCALFSGALIYIHTVPESHANDKLPLFAFPFFQFLNLGVMLPLVILRPCPQWLPMIIFNLMAAFFYTSAQGLTSIEFKQGESIRQIFEAYKQLQQQDNLDGMDSDIVSALLQDDLMKERDSDHWSLQAIALIVMTFLGGFLILGIVSAYLVHLGRRCRRNCYDGDLAELDQLEALRQNAASSGSQDAVAQPSILFKPRITILTESEEKAVKLQDGGAQTCVICITNIFQESSAAPRVSRLPNCQHLFHADCIFKWATYSCPTCRTKITSVSEPLEDQEQISSPQTCATHQGNINQVVPAPVELPPSNNNQLSISEIDLELSVAEHPPQSRPCVVLSMMPHPQKAGDQQYCK